MVCSRTAFERLRMLSASGLMLSVSSHAAAQSEPIRIDYRADAACPSAERFTSDVLRRTPLARAALAGEAARTFVIVIERAPAGFAGSLAVREGQKETYSRRVKGARCSEVAEVLALSTAIAVDPAAQSQPAPVRVDDTNTEPTGPASTTVPPSQTNPSNASEPEQSTTDVEPAEEADHDHDQHDDVVVDVAPPEPPMPVQTEWSYALLAGPDLRMGNSPRPALGGSARFDARAPSSAWPLGAVGLELAWLQSLTGSTDGASSSFRFLLARPHLCSSPARPSTALRIAPCLVAELGVVTGRGSNLPEPATEHRFWAALEIPLRVELDLSARSLLGLSAGLVVPATRYQFSFLDPETSIYEVPAAGFAAGMKFGMRL